MEVRAPPPGKKTETYLLPPSPLYRNLPDRVGKWLKFYLRTADDTGESAVMEGPGAPPGKNPARSPLFALTSLERRL